MDVVNPLVWSHRFSKLRPRTAATRKALKYKGYGAIYAAMSIAYRSLGLTNTRHTPIPRLLDEMKRVLETTHNCETS